MTDAKNKQRARLQSRPDFSTLTQVFAVGWLEQTTYVQTVGLACVQVLDFPTARFKL